MQTAIQLQLNFHKDQPRGEDALCVPIDSHFPEQAANELSSMESFNKHLYRPNTYLHKWWARRSGTTFRYILKQLVDQPGLRDFYESGGLEGKIILDPMVGGGTTVHEAIRMGANVVGIDIDPIPVLQTIASLNWINVHGEQTTFNRFFNELRKILSPFYITRCPACGQESEVQFVLYGLRKKCACQEVLFVDSLVLRQEENEPDVMICPKCREVYSTPTHTCSAEFATETILTKGLKQCDRCQAAFSELLDESFQDRYVPLVIVGSCSSHGQFFKGVDREDQALIRKAYSDSRRLDFGSMANFQVPSGPKSNDLRRRNIRSFLGLFTGRQLLYLYHANRLLSKLPADQRLWASLLVSTSIEFNSLLCGYKGAEKRRPGAIRHVFSHHAYSFPHTALENNPVFTGHTSGTLRILFRDRVSKAVKWAMAPVERKNADGKTIQVSIQGEIDGGQQVTSFKDLSKGSRRFLILQGDSGDLDLPSDSVDYVVTDPPYYDSVQYSDLSNFFRVWLKLFLPGAANWNYDHLASAVSGQDASDNDKYCIALTQIWQTCKRVLKKDRGRLIFTFHHWRPEAWSELTLSLRNAGFVLANRYVVFSENPISVHIKNLKALKHDTILVLRPKTGQTETVVPLWTVPSSIDKTSSYQFCLDCGTALGWFLSTKLNDSEIDAQWNALIRKTSNGKTSK